MTTASAARPRAPRAGRVPRRMTDEELTSLMGLLRGADSTELKLTVPPASHRDTVQGLPIDPVESQPRQVWFFDTPDLALNRAGLVVRARRIRPLCSVRPSGRPGQVAFGSAAFANCFT